MFTTLDFGQSITFVSENFSEMKLRNGVTLTLCIHLYASPSTSAGVFLPLNTFSPPSIFHWGSVVSQQ